MSKTVYVIAALVVIGGIIWYVMRAQRQAATISTSTAAGVAPPNVPGAAT